MSNWASLKASLAGKHQADATASITRPVPASQLAAANARPLASPNNGKYVPKRHKKPKPEPQVQAPSQEQLDDLITEQHAAPVEPGALDERVRSTSDVPVYASPTTSPMATSTPWLEAERLRAVLQLSELFRERCEALGGRKHYAHFESWLWAARAETPATESAGGCMAGRDGGGGGGDLDAGIVPPIPPRPSSAAREELTRKLVLAGVSKLSARSTCDALDSLCGQLYAELMEEEEHRGAVGGRMGEAGGDEGGLLVRVLPIALEGEDGWVGGAAGHSGAAMGASARGGKRKRGEARRGEAKRGEEQRGNERNGDSGVQAAEVGNGRRVRLVYGRTEVIVTEAHLAKLRALYRINGGGGNGEDGGGESHASKPNGSQAGRGTGTESGAAGGEQRRSGASNQMASADEASFLSRAFCCLGACPPQVFNALRADFGVSSECFASPLNARFPTFCSAAVDVDSPFGSRGSFFGFRPTSGAFLANPPFEPGLVAAMAARMEALLTEADVRSSLLTFVVVIPTWPGTSCWQRLEASPHNAALLRLPSSKHAYIDGGQHQGRRARPLRLSNHDTSMFFLMSRRAAALTPLTFAKERRLREAFTGGLHINGALHK